MALESDVAAILPPKLAQPLNERTRMRMLRLRPLHLCRGAAAEHVGDHRALRLLCRHDEGIDDQRGAGAQQVPPLDCP